VSWGAESYLYACILETAKFPGDTLGQVLQSCMLFSAAYVQLLLERDSW
jgi:hypothetical protein